MKRITIIATAALALVLALATPSCQSDFGQLLEQATKDAAEATIESEKRIEDRIAELIAQLNAGDLTTDEVKDQAKAITKEEGAALKAELESIARDAKAEAERLKDGWFERGIGGLGDAIAGYGQHGSIWLALGSLLGSVLYTRNRTQLAKYEINDERDQKYKPGGPFASVQPGQQQFQAHPTQPMAQPPQVVYVQAPPQPATRATQGHSAPIVPLDAEGQA